MNTDILIIYTGLFALLTTAVAKLASAGALLTIRRKYMLDWATIAQQLSLAFVTLPTLYRYALPCSFYESTCHPVLPWIWSAGNVSLAISSVIVTYFVVRYRVIPVLGNNTWHTVRNFLWQRQSPGAE